MYDNRGVCLTDPLARKGLPKWRKELWKLSKRLIDLYVPGYGDTHFSVQFGKMSSPSHYVNYHTDDKDIAPQYHMTCGSYRGAYLECYDVAGCSYGYYSVPYHLLHVDGRLGHQVRKTNFEGPHISIIFFQTYSPHQNFCDDILFPPQYVL